MGGGVNENAREPSQSTVTVERGEGHAHGCAIAVLVVGTCVQPHEGHDLPVMHQGGYEANNAQ